ncbi:11418_t:CDS:2, partial [Racocetra persica]
AEEVDLIESLWDSSQLKPLVNRYTEIIKNHVDDYSFNVDFKALLTDLMKQKRENYNHPEDYETFWYHNFYIQIILQMIRKYSSIYDNTISKYQYREEIVNILLASIFHDIETAIWIQTGEIENDTRKRQINFSKKEGDRERLGDKQDEIFYYNLNSIKVSVGYMEVVGNAFASNMLDKNSDLEKLLKAMMISLWYQDAHQQINVPKKLQSFAILVFGREFHFLCMRLINNVYMVDEYNIFVLPDSGSCFLQIEKIVEIVKKFKMRIKRYYHELTKRPQITKARITFGHIEDRTRGKNIVRHANARVISSIGKIKIQLLQLFGDALNVPECQDVHVTTM